MRRLRGCFRHLTQIFGIVHILWDKRVSWCGLMLPFVTVSKSTMYCQFIQYWLTRQLFVIWVRFLWFLCYDHGASMVLCADNTFVWMDRRSCQHLLKTFVVSFFVSYFFPVYLKSIPSVLNVISNSTDMTIFYILWFCQIIPPLVVESELGITWGLSKDSRFSCNVSAWTCCEVITVFSLSRGMLYSQFSLWFCCLPWWMSSKQVCLAQA